MKESPTLVSRMKQGEFLTIVQLHPPKNEELDSFKHALSRIKETGITLFDINSSPTQTRMNPFAVAAEITEPGLVLIPHITARDPIEPTVQNISQGYQHHTIENVLIVGGDAPKTGQFATTLKDVMKSVAHERKAKNLKQLKMGASFNQNENDQQKEAENLRNKIKRGADFFMSQIVFDPSQARDLHQLYSEHTDKPLIAGIWPFTDPETADKIHNGTIKGIEMPDTVYTEATARRDNPDTLKSWSFAQAKETIDVIKREKLAQGVYVVAPLNNPIEIVDFLKTLH